LARIALDLEGTCPEQIPCGGVYQRRNMEGAMETRTRRKIRKIRIQSQINITPLIDVLLVLIVIFMVISPVTPTGLEAQIPQQNQAAANTHRQTQDALVLTVERDGAITINRNRVNSNAELTSELQDIFKTRNDRTIFIQGARTLDFDVIAHVIDTALGSGASRIGLLTDEIR
jgi:biopolymer transport protein TolR